MPENMVNRWERRKTYTAGKGQLYWHMLLSGNTQIDRLTSEAHRRISGISGLDLTPHKYVHLTLLFCGPADEFTVEQTQVMASNATSAFASMTPITLAFERVLYHPEAIAIEAHPASRLEPLITALQEVTFSASGKRGVLAQPWIPHVTVAYSAADMPAAPIIEALGKSLPEAIVTVGNVSLVFQEGSEDAWNWHELAHIRLGP
ncbi:2'-5' RNA ligase family protein [Herbidospora yilanensis]|uniref:2'-5' RNA ligase family protein n=1 Tax=Herbidospora yilanensis TaxID=354426 RepID=UPI0018DE72BF|nr:2'-5' RNA ligase family protein [Herbidospora yilanensis]